MRLKATKHRYSGKVRALGYGIIILEIVTIVVLLVAVYSNARVVTSVGSSLSTIGGNGFASALQNRTDPNTGKIEHAFVIPDVTNNGYLPVTLSINANFLGSANIPALSQSITIDPGQTKPLEILTGVGSSTNISGLSGVHLRVEISSIAGLVGGGLTVTYTK